MALSSPLWTHFTEAKEKYKNEPLTALYYNTITGFVKDDNNEPLFYIGYSANKNFINSTSIYEGLILSYNDLDTNVFDYAKLYLPLLFCKELSKERPFVVGHIAQTLDGKICTYTGSSKWISNEENLFHSHRLRAMSDAVLVGSGTVREDTPQLTVRRVKGKNPVRLFWSNSINDFSSCAVDNATTFLIKEKGESLPCPKGIDKVIEYSKENPFNDVFKQLKKEGINSIFIEGGSHTLSKFHEAKAIDLLQVHIAPIMFGSGKNGIIMEPIENVADALKFDGSFIRLGDHVMFSGKPIY